MPELNPRPHKPNLFVQVSVAVISGAAVMYVVQNFSDAPAFQKLFGKAPPPAAAKPREPEKPNEATLPNRPAPTAEDLADINAVRGQGPVPAPSSMMVVPEPGGRESGILAIDGDESMLEPETPRPDEEARGTREARPRTLSATGAPVRHLEDTGDRSVIGGVHVGKGFGGKGLHLHEFAKKEAPAAAAPQARRKAKPQARHYAVVFEKTPIPRKDLFVPGMLNPDVAPEKEFWDEQRKRNVSLAALLAVFGVLYLCFATGVFGVGKRRTEDGEPS